LLYLLSAMKFFAGLKKCKRIQKSQSQVFLALLLIVALVLTACSPAPLLLSCVPTEMRAAMAMTAKTPDLSLEIAIDGTPSMQGYVNGFSNSRYVETLQLLDRVAATAWVGTPAQVSYLRFGTKLEKLDRSQFRQAQLPGFYGVGEQMRVSNITAAIPPKPDKKLSLIVTDLYQQDADVTLVQSQLTQKYLQQGLAVGVLAIRSEFKGTIYDVGLQQQQFSYASSDDPKTLHPFYVLMLGTYPDIRHFYEAFLTASQSIPAFKEKPGEFVIFYPQFVESTSTLDLANLPELPNHLRRVNSLKRNNLLVRAETREPIEFFRIAQAETANLAYRISYRPLAHTLTPVANALKIEAKTLKLRSKNDQEDVSTLGGLVASQAKLSNANPSTPQQLTLQTQLNPTRLEPGIYSYEVTLTPAELQSPNWWQQWDAVPGKLDGSKTHNLSRFLESLKSSTTALTNQPKSTIARLCYAIQK
jgi:hypothetical protein